MDLLYILGTGSTWANNELRMSLRSAHQFYSAVGKVVVVGYSPPWLVNIEHIACKDDRKLPLENLKTKLRVALDSGKLNDGFLLMNDDFFFLRRMDSVPIYIKGRLLDSLSTHGAKHTFYYRNMMDTLKFLQNKGTPDPLDFGIHAPMPLHPVLVDETLKSMGNRAVLFRTAYGNQHVRKATCERTEDFKVKRSWSPPPAHWDFLSTDAHSAGGLRCSKWFVEKYPEPSPYENPYILFPYW